MADGAVVCVGVNGYDDVYGPWIKTHRKYAKRHGFDYVIATEPEHRIEKVDAAWLKIELLLDELRRGSEWVMMIDSDCKVNRRCPAMWEVARGERDIYAARGHSGRWNSGVVIVQNGPDSIKAIQRIRDSRETPVPEDEWNGWRDWGENGHVIHELDRYEGVEELDVKWNNATELTLPDYIRHFTGPTMGTQDAAWGLGRRRKAAKAKFADLPPVPGETVAERLEWLSPRAQRFPA